MVQALQVQVLGFGWHVSKHKLSVAGVQSTYPPRDQDDRALRYILLYTHISIIRELYG